MDEAGQLPFSCVGVLLLRWYAFLFSSSLEEGQGAMQAKKGDDKNRLSLPLWFACLFVLRVTTGRMGLSHFSSCLFRMYRSARGNAITYIFCFFPIFLVLVLVGLLAHVSGGWGIVCAWVLSHYHGCRGTSRFPRSLPSPCLPTSSLFSLVLTKASYQMGEPMAMRRLHCSWRMCFLYVRECMDYSMH